MADVRSVSGVRGIGGRAYLLGRAAAVGEFSTSGARGASLRGSCDEIEARVTRKPDPDLCRPTGGESEVHGSMCESVVAKIRWL